MKDLSFLFKKAYFFLKFRLRTEKELENYLLKKINNTNYSQKDVKNVIEKLKKDNLINDAKFTELYIKTRLTLKPRGRKLLIQELKNKGIASSLIEEYFNNNKIDEEKSAYDTIKKYWKRLNNLNQKKFYEKSMRILLSRGFSYEIAKKTIEEFIKKE